jgi:hypothetical protein
MSLIFALSPAPTSDSWAEVTALATVGLFFAACVAGLIAKKQIGKLNEQLELQRHVESRKRVYEHLSRLFDRDFLIMTAEAQNFFRTHPGDASSWEDAWGKKTDRQQAMITAVLNFYEIVAIEYNDQKDELLDRALAKKTLPYLVGDVWLLAEPFVHWIREEVKDDGAYAEWELMYRKADGTVTPAGPPASAPAAPGSAPPKPVSPD